MKKSFGHLWIWLFLAVSSKTEIEIAICLLENCIRFDIDLLKNAVKENKPIQFFECSSVTLSHLRSLISIVRTSQSRSFWNNHELPFLYWLYWFWKNCFIFFALGFKMDWIIIKFRICNKFCIQMFLCIL